MCQLGRVAGKGQVGTAGGVGLYLDIMPAQRPAEGLGGGLFGGEAGGIAGRGIAAAIAVGALAVGEEARGKAGPALKGLADAFDLDDVHAEGVNHGVEVQQGGPGSLLG